MTATHTKTFTVTYFANPYLECGRCRLRAAGFQPGTAILWPCGHKAMTHSVCPSWGPVEGCRCAQILGSRDHGEPPMPDGFNDPLDGAHR